MSSRSSCCTIKSLEEENAALEAENAALAAQVAGLTEDLTNCTELAAGLYPGDPVLLATAVGIPGGPGTITDSINTIGADFIVASVVRDTAGPMADGLNNVWTLAGTSGTPPSPVQEFWVCRDPAVSDLHNFHYGTGAANNATLLVAAFSWAGAPETPPYVGSDLPVAETISPGSLTGQSGKVLFFAAVGTEGCSPLTVNDGFSMPRSIVEEVVFGSHGAAIAFKLVNGPATATPTFGLSFAGQAVAGLLAFNATVPVIPPALETTAWEHWIPELGPASLTGKVAAKPLTPLATVAWSHKSVICPANLPGFINGLDTGFLEAPGFTLCLVIKRPQVVFGDEVYIAGTNNIIGGTGGGISARGASPDYLTVFGATVPLPGGASVVGPWNNLGIDPGFLPGEWCFVVLQFDASEPIGHIEPAPGFYPLTDSVIPSANKLVIGNGYHASNIAAKQLEVAEVILFNTVLSSAALTAVYQRSKLRMAAKGIGIAGSLQI